MLTLAANHFTQTIQALKIGRHIKISHNQEAEIKLPKKNPKFKTVFLDLDETLIHCDENATNYTVKLDFPVDGGSIVSVYILLHRQGSVCDRTANSFYKSCHSLLKSSYSQPAVHHMLT